MKQALSARLFALICSICICLPPAAMSAAASSSSDQENSQEQRDNVTAQMDYPIRPQPSFVHPTDKAFIHKFLKEGQYMPVSEIRPGMVGYGLTVFRGNKVERFNVQIISVVKKILSGRDAILARLSGGEMGTNCVIKGMSGSPCYINGKLIGAVSFGFEFEKEPIAGITPIVDMLDALAEPAAGSKPYVAHLSAPSWSIPAEHAAGLENTGSGAPRMIPLVSPVSLVGFSPRAESYLADKFKDIGLGVAAGAAGGLDPELATVDKEIKPGSALAVMLATGDFNIAATGTATAKFGDKIVAFGHTFMQGGSLEMPMASAYVHQVMPALSASFKLASPVSVVGAVTADRPWGVGGCVGKMCPMIPATYTIVDETRHIERTYHCDVINHPEMTPEILAATATSAIDATHQATGPYVAKVESRIEAEGIEPIVRTDRFATGITPKTFTDLFLGGDPVGRYVQRATDAICNNDFQKAAIKSVNLKVTIQDGHQTAKIERVYIDKPYAAPGDEVAVTAIIKPFNRDEFQETLKFRVPRDLPDGNMVIGIAGGQDYDYIKSRLGIVDPEPENVKQIAQQLRDEGRGDQIALIAALPEESLMCNGTKLVNPPAYWTKVFFSNRHTKGPTLVKAAMKTVRDENWMLFGSHIIALEVRSKDKAEARSAPYPISAPPSSGDDVAITDQARKAMEAFPGIRKLPSQPINSNTPGGQNNGQPALTAAIQATITAPQPSTAASTKTPAASPAISAATGKEYPHVRPLQIWRQDSDDEFRSGKLDDCTVDSWGRISPGFDSVADKQVSTEDQIWSSACCNGDFYYGSGDEVWRWKGNDSAPEKVAKLEGLFIPAMVSSKKGIIYAAPVPSGHIWAIDTTGKSKPKIIFKASEPIITSLALDDHDNLYAGAASTGKLYKINANGRGTQVLDCDQAHVLCMFYCRPEKTLYFGTGEKGSVYALTDDGKIRAVYQSPDHFVTGVVKDKKGDLYVASAGQGHLVRIAPSGEQTTLATSEAFYTLRYDEASDSVFSGDAEGDITMACIDALTKQPYFMPICHTEQEAVLALSSDGKELFAGTSNLAVLRSFRMQLSSKPLYISAVRDAGRQATWSRVHPFGACNEINAQLTAKLKIDTRTGNTSKPDDTWSAWQPTVEKEGSFAIASPLARYFQYRLSWNTEGDTFGTDKIDKLTLGRVDTTFLPENSAPQITHVSLKPGTALSGKQDIAVTGTDSDGDNLLLSIDISSDDGATWRPVKDDIRSKSSKKDGDEDKDKDKDKDKAKGKDEAKAGDKDKAADTDKDGDKPSATDDGSADNPSKDKDSSSDSDKSGNGGSGSDTSEAGHKKESNSGTNQKPTENHAVSHSSSAPWQTGYIATDADTGIAPIKGKHHHGAGRNHKSSKGEQSDKDDKSDHATGTSSTGTDKGNNEAGGPSTENFTYSWDTSKVKDGNYLVRITVDDKLSNPDDPQQIVNLRSVTVDNSGPEIALIDYKQQSDGKLEFKVTAKDKFTAIANATYKIDDGEPFAFTFAPDSIDSLNATLLASDVSVGHGKHKLEVKVSDRAGNTATKSINIKG